MLPELNADILILGWTTQSLILTIANFESSLLNNDLMIKNGTD